MTEVVPLPSRRRNMAGPRTWAAARELYLSGLTAGEVGARLGLTVHAIRARISREGWTKSAQADARLGAAAAPVAGALARPAAAPPQAEVEPGAGDDAAPAPDPEQLAREVGRRAARALAAGRTAEAAALARTGELVLAFLDRLPPDEPEAPDFDPTAMWCEDVWKTAVRLADSLLKDGNMPAVHTRAAFRWRADNLGSEVAAADRARAEEGGWSRSVYDDDGVLLAPESFEAFSRRVAGRTGG